MRVLLRVPTEPPATDSPDRPLDFHRRLPGYCETPLVDAPRIAEKLGVAKLFVKDETSRFGMPSCASGSVRSQTARSRTKSCSLGLGHWVR
jgi:diaminopropionate ammonia-lyase